MLRILFSIILALTIIKDIENARIVWKVKPQPVQIAKENDNVKLNCEFENLDKDSGSYFVIWYKDGLSQNVLALNDQLGNLNSTNMEISGKYNLIIKNVTRANSGLYTCQLFQSSDLIASVNLTVLVPPKYSKITLKYPNDDESSTEASFSHKGYLVENEQVNLECCTNADANPQPMFEWHRFSRRFLQTASTASKSSTTIVKYKLLNPHNQSASYYRSERVCNVLQLNLSRADNSYVYKCFVTNDALMGNKKIESSLSLTVEFKPTVSIYPLKNSATGASKILKTAPLTLQNHLSVVENSSISLYCNASALPNIITYEWFFNDYPIRDYRADTLNLSGMKRTQSGNYSCKATNRHGSSKSFFYIEILYSQIIAANKSSSFVDSYNLKQPGVVYMTTFENTSIILSCEIQSNPLTDKVLWYYFQITKDNIIINKVLLSNWISDTLNELNEQAFSKNTLGRRYYSKLSLNNVTANHSGYYMCSINPTLMDDLNQTVNFFSNATYFLQVQYSPIVTTARSVIYANNYDQVELSCEVKSNPQSIFSWFYGNKELFSSYKYNLSSTVYKQIQRNYLDDIENVHYYKSILVVNSLTQFDFGDYHCRANNIIGESSQAIKLKRKQKPETPIDFKIIEVTSNSVQLSWIAGSNGGENSTYLITINDMLNMTTFTENDNSDKDEESDSESSEQINLRSTDNRYNQIEIRGLQSQQIYEFKLLAYNTMGASEYSNKIKVKTLQTNLKSEAIPAVLNAQFNDIREAICFDLEPSLFASPHNVIDFNLNSYFNDKGLRDLIIKLEVDLGASNKSDSTKQKQSTSIRTYLISLTKLKYGQNCIQYSQLVELDWQLRNSSSTYSKLQSAGSMDVISKKKRIFMLNAAASITTTAHSQSPTSLLYSKSSNHLTISIRNSGDILGRNFVDFKRHHKVNISICYTNDTSICAQEIHVLDYSPDFSTYITLVAIGCSAILIFIILLLASLCCCCCRRRRKQKQGQNDTKKIDKNDINSKLVIKSFPIVTAQQTNFDYSDGSTKSSQQHILNASGSHSSSSSTSGHDTNDVGEINYLKNEKIYYSSSSNQNDTSLFDSNTVSNVNKYGTANFKIDYMKQKNNSSSIATVESDASSSSSIENKTTSTTSNCGKSSIAHSPFTILPDNNANSNYFASISSSSYSNIISHKPPMSQNLVNANNSKQTPQTLVYSGSNNVYIKSYQPQHSQQMQSQQQYKNHQQLSSSDSPESGYSTPINNLSKKLVYEVIV